MGVFINAIHKKLIIGATPFRDITQLNPYPAKVENMVSS